MTPGADASATVVRVSTRAVAVGVFLLLIAGALVTSTESGLAVPDWPLSYGKVIPPMVGGILYEHGHRLVAAAVSTLAGIQVAILLLFERERAVRRLGLLAFGTILLQALLGGLTVILLLPPAVSSAHAALAEIVFALTVAAALLTSRLYRDGLGTAAPAERPAARHALRIVLAASAATYLQIVLGAVMRHTGAGLAIPDFPLAFGRFLPPAEALAQRGVGVHLAHRLGAAAVFALVLLAARALARLDGVHALFPRLGVVWTFLVTVQVLFGALSVWSRKAAPVTAVHLATGALCWVTGVAAALSLARVCREAPAGAYGSAA